MNLTTATDPVNPQLFDQYGEPIRRIDATLRQRDGVIRVYDADGYCVPSHDWPDDLTTLEPIPPDPSEYWPTPDEIREAVLFLAEHGPSWYQMPEPRELPAWHYSISDNELAEMLGSTASQTYMH